jgi:hypothetical protein
MSNEVTVPLLPCAVLDDMIAFYEVLGFETTYRQQKPNPCAGVRREDLHLQFFEIPGFVPADSYGSCLVLTSDTGALHAAFAAGMRAAYGKVLVSGIPRMTRPRPRKNADGVSGFSVVDPGGNWIRVFRNTTEAAAQDERPAKVSRLAKALADAVVQADSRGEHRQAARILDSALARAAAEEDPVVLVEVLVFRAEVAMALGDPGTAAGMLQRARTVPLTPEETARAAAARDNAADLESALPPAP